LRHIKKLILIIRTWKVKRMEIKVLFFGVLAEVTMSSIKYYREVKSINDLKFRILDDFPEIEFYDFRISLNNEIINDNRSLNNGDEVSLMPPFAGG
jgi:molybdopterin synthase sulfur carrier subunit